MKTVVRLTGSAFLISATLLGVALSVSATSTETLTAYFYDVGQGDAVLIRTPDHHSILIDGGPDHVLPSKIGRSVPFYDRTIDLMVLTHPHADHMVGLIDVIDRFDVRRVLLTEVAAPESEEYRALLDRIREKRIPIEYPTVGRRYAFGEGTFLDIVAPAGSFKDRTVSDLNDSSIVAILSYDEIKILLTGDAGSTIEEQILASKIPLTAQILKAGHHGSRHSSSEKFIQAVDPDVAIISAGTDNQYGHPHREVLKRFENHDVKVYRTDKQGDVRLKTDGHTYSLSTTH